MKFSGRTTSHSHKFDDWQSKPANGGPCVKKVTFMDIQWSDCPVEIEDIVKKMWRDHELGNDKYFLRFTGFDDLYEMMVGEDGDETDYNTFKAYCESQGIKPDEEVLIHWWW